MNHRLSECVAAILGASTLLVVASAATVAGDLLPADEKTLAQHLVETAGTAHGICSVLGCDNGDFPVELARNSELIVHVRDPRESAVAACRTVADKAGLYGTKVVAEKGPLDRLPYADNTVDLLIAPHLNPSVLGKLSAVEVLRSLRPQGKAILGRAKGTRTAGASFTGAELSEWLTEAQIAGASVTEDEYGLWAVFTKPALKGADDWSHWEHRPDNNPVSKDSVIKAPYMTKWLGSPYYIAMPAITTAAGGRVFDAFGHIAHHVREEPWLNTLLARNGYNGTILWTRKLPDGYLVHRSAFIATPETFYMIDADGSGCLMLDPETGDEQGRIEIAGARGQWKWMAMQDGILFALAGDEKDPAETTIVRSELTHWSWDELSSGYYQKRVPWGFGNTLAAWDLASKKSLWTHREKQNIDSRAMVIGDENVVLYCPDARIVALNLRTGKVVWENADEKVRALIEEEGRGLTSTPGFKTMTYCVYTPNAIVFQGQTRMNVVAISPADGYMLWTKKKTTNNPNTLFIDDSVVLGVGKDGTTQMIDPASGEVVLDLGFKKRSCARLTATSDSLFCRGWPEGLTRYDRDKKKVLFNGAFRPGCNDGMVAANGLLYTGPWPCDCNLMLLGQISLTSAGDFQFNHVASDEERLEAADDSAGPVVAFPTNAADWATYRGSNVRGAATAVATPREIDSIWNFEADTEFRPSAATTAGGLVFVAGDDGKVRAVDAVTGQLKWTFLTAGPIFQPPTIWNDRAFVGSGDGCVYALEAATGRLLWKFRAAPVERLISVYEKISSTWPVHSGVLAADGTVYIAAGIIDYDGTYVYALDALTGKIKWQNNSSGHLDPDLRKGASAHGDLTIASGRLWLAAGNVVSPAAYDLATGEYVGKSPGDGSPTANRGEEIGIFQNDFVVVGGRIRYSPVENVVNPGSFVAHAIGQGREIGTEVSLHQGKIPPAWSDTHTLMVDGRLAVPACYDADEVVRYLRDPKEKPKARWVAEALKGGDTVALAVSPNAALAVCEMPRPRSRETRWIVVALDLDDGKTVWERELPGAVRPGGLSVDRDGRIVVVLSDGRVTCYGEAKNVRAQLSALLEEAKTDTAAKDRTVASLARTLRTTHSGEVYDLALRSLETLGVEIDALAHGNGAITRWRLIAPVPWNVEHDLDAAFVGEPDVDTNAAITVAGRSLAWRSHLTDETNGMVDLAALYGPHADVAAYASAEFELPADRDLLLKLGSNDGGICWFNGKEVSRYDQPPGRGYVPDQDVVRVQGKAGTNRVLLKITQYGSRWAFGVRFTDRDGKPIHVKQVTK